MSEKIEFGTQLEIWKRSPERKSLYDQIQNYPVSLAKREGFISLLNQLDVESHGLSFYDQPASTKFHGSSLGGLARHCLKVKAIFEEWVMKYNLPISEESIYIVSIFHDLCKWGSYHPKVTLKGFLDERSPFTFSNDFMLGHGEESVIKLLQSIRLTKQEIQIIRWHMGPFDKNWFNFNTADVIKQQEPLAIFFYLADHLASVLEDLNE